jgi:hypothetical protein
MKVLPVSTNVERANELHWIEFELGHMPLFDLERHAYGHKLCYCFINKPCLGVYW